MTMEGLIQWVLSTSLHNWVISTPWAWPTFETFHFIGLCLLLGAMLIIDLRLAGFWKQIRITTIHNFLPFAAIGFLINFLTGIMFIFGEPKTYALNVGFQLKILLILIAGINALWFSTKINPVMHAWPPHGNPPTVAKLIAYLSLISWFGILLLGRLIPYVGTGAA